MYVCLSICMCGIKFSSKCHAEVLFGSEGSEMFSVKRIWMKVLSMRLF